MTARLPDLASERLGARIVAASDAFFGPAENLLKAGDPVREPDRYTDSGKWMDGWETRRRRGPGQDWVVVRLGIPGIVRQVVVDTRHFKGNHPESATVEGCWFEGESEGEWSTLVPRSPLEADAENEFAVTAAASVTHVRLTIHPDGGVARLRVRGQAAPRRERATGGGPPVDLAAIGSGGLVLACSDEFFSAPEHLLMPGRAASMADGWETRRRRGPGHDWVVVRLGGRGRIVRAEIDTHWFKGNYPESASIDVADAPDSADPVDLPWRTILPRTRLGADAEHVFAPPVLKPAIGTHARLSIHPDGGVARLRLFGEILQ